MEPGTLLYALLTTAAPVAALLGYVDPQLGQQYRIYPLRAPQGTPFPYACYQVISQKPDDSAQCELDDYARVQLSLFTKTYTEVCALSQATRAALHRQRVGTVAIDLDQQLDQYSDPAFCYYRTQDYLLEGLA
ncbi:MAG: tail completion protein gp17, partial [Janthinobacterium lividum]